MDLRVTIKWTTTAKEGLRKLPKQVRRTLFKKVDELAGGDPRQRCKPLIGSLAGYYTMPCGRYRAVYRVQEETAADGSARLHLIVLFLAVGIRKEGDKSDVYRLAQRLVQFGIIEADENQAGDDSP